MNHREATRDTFSALADPTRRAILEMLLREGPLRAGDVAGAFPAAARPGISRHLRVLREAELVEVRSEGRQRFYELNAKPLADLHQGWLADFARMYTESLSALRRKVEGARAPLPLETGTPECKT